MRVSEKAGFYTQALAPDSSGRTAGSCEERTVAQCPRQPWQARGYGKGVHVLGKARLGLGARPRGAGRWPDAAVARRAGAREAV
jgi:hypothetical protein